MESGLKRLLIIIGVIVVATTIFTIIRSHRAKEKYHEQIKKLETALQLWGDDYQHLLPKKKGDVITVPLRTLKQSNYIENRFVNPKERSIFSNQLLMRIEKKEQGYTYQVLDQDKTMVKDYDDVNKKAPMIILNGKETEYAELNTPYEDLGYQAITLDGKMADDTKLEIWSDGKPVSSVDTSKLATYQITYRVSYAKEDSTITRNVIVRDTQKPSIEMDRVTLKVDEVKDYSLLNDVIIKDNSDAPLKIEISGSLAAIPGRYVLTYKVRDQSNNIREKKRIVRVEE